MKNHDNDIPESQASPSALGSSPVAKFAPEPFTAHWHAYELGRIAFQGEGDLCISPFEGYYKSLELAWEDGWNYGRQAFDDEMQAIREKAKTKPA